MPANRSRTARHRPLRLRRVVPSLVATALAVLLIPLPAVAVNTPSRTSSRSSARTVRRLRPIQLPGPVDGALGDADV
jgi:hypothetical protein